MRILIVGGGNMGLTFARSFLRGSIVEAHDLHILERHSDKVAQLTALDICQVHADAGAWVDDVDIIILAVKPQDTAPVYDLLCGRLSDDQVVLSIMAGVTMHTLRAALHTDRILRAMPNLPAQVGVGMTVYTATDEVSRPQLVEVTNLLNTTGKTIYVESEQMIDAATAISGSGPAYVFYMIEALTTSAVDLGFSRAQAELLATQTFAGAQALLRAGSSSCQEWIDRVSSRGGTTEAAITCMQDLQVAEDFAKGVLAAYNRAVELGKLDT